MFSSNQPMSPGLVHHWNKPKLGGLWSHPNNVVCSQSIQSSVNRPLAVSSDMLHVRVSTVYVKALLTPCTLLQYVTGGFATTIYTTIWRWLYIMYTCVVYRAQWSSFRLERARVRFPWLNMYASVLCDETRYGYRQVIGRIIGVSTWDFVSGTKARV